MRFELRLPTLLTASAILTTSGCGATSARLGVGPAIDSNGRVTIESTFSLGFGMPLDYEGRSKHYLQAASFIGGGADVDTGAKIFTTGLGVDYIYWGHRRFDVRTGAYFVYRYRPEPSRDLDLLGLGAHLGLMPIVKGTDSDIFVPQVCIGPEFRIDQTWDASSNRSRTQFTVPLVVEFNLLAAGD
jgi:hypothetical protein